MHHIISNIDKTINLQQYIDNRDGDKRIGLKCITCGVGWYNIVDEYVQKMGERPHKIVDGKYSFQQITGVFKTFKISLSVTLERLYHPAVVSGEHFTQGTILIVVLVPFGSAKSRVLPVHCGWLSK